MSSEQKLPEWVQGCPACEMEWRGWGGRGCCEICDQHHYEHTCEEPGTKEESE